jgi:hypothetical protein
MLGSARDKCPICSAPSCSCGGPSNIREHVGVTAMGGKLVKVPTGRPGVSIQMYEQEAAQRGLLPKKAEPVANKKRRPVLNKERP